METSEIMMSIFGGWYSRDTGKDLLYDGFTSSEFEAFMATKAGSEIDLVTSALSLRMLLIQLAYRCGESDPCMTRMLPSSRVVPRCLPVDERLQDEWGEERIRE
ncbi:hypothetical protein QCA50_007920 [Cerrena zonata]|uniref:Uncharacterized protein n=1 Tax=Cerrena zonata TaxID=2478898 RepID=A0AAW0GHL3_9APHY